MHISVVTNKGQTTIPKEVRDYLHIQAADKIVYIPDGKRIFLTAIRGSILDLKGSAKHLAKKTVDFQRLREQIKEDVVKDIMEEMK